jgi:hypothetical protein
MSKIFLGRMNTYLLDVQEVLGAKILEYDIVRGEGRLVSPDEHSIPFRSELGAYAEIDGNLIGFYPSSAGPMLFKNRVQLPLSDSQYQLEFHRSGKKNDLNTLSVRKNGEIEWSVTYSRVPSYLLGPDIWTPEGFPEHQFDGLLLLYRRLENEKSRQEFIAKYTL